MKTCKSVGLTGKCGSTLLEDKNPHYCLFSNKLKLGDLCMIHKSPVTFVRQYMGEEIVGKNIFLGLGPKTCCWRGCKEKMKGEI